MATVIQYTPTKKQLMFHESKAKEVLYGGAAGGGKTKCTVMDALFRCLQWPKTTAYIFRRTYRELEDTVIKEANASYPASLGRYSVSQKSWQLKNGSEIRFRHCENAKDRYIYSGAEIQWLYFDELTTFEQEVYDFLKTRVRAKKSLGVVPVIRATSNPGNIGHGWVKKYFVDAGPYMSYVKQEVFSQALQKSETFYTQYIPSLAMENPHISDDYIYELERKPDALRRALLNGDWDAFEGQVFVEFKNDPAHYDDRRWTHVINPFPIPDSWTRVMSFDHGYSRPFSIGWWAIAPDGRAYRYKEWYGCLHGKPNAGIAITPREIAEGIIEREAEEMRNNIFIDRVADPAIFDKSRGLSVADQMDTCGGRPGVWFRKGDNARIAGKMALHDRLRFNDKGKPMLYVFNTCTDWIRTVPNLPYSETRKEDIDTASEDHAYDETRYFLMANPLPKEEDVAPQPRDYDPYRRNLD